ncbi:hypothetical protein ACLB2K_019280 [Fragaria x ananassa]
MLQTPPFKGANVFMSRKLVPPEIFDALHDALKLNGANVVLCCDPSRTGPDDFHVIASSDHEKFEDLRAKGCQLLGPQCVFSCANEHRSLPKQGFTCCLALDGVNVLASGFEADEKIEIRNLITSMGGVLHTKTSLDVSFVIAKDVLATKYKWALYTLKKPVLTINWLYQCCKEHRIVPQESFRVLPFSGLMISVTRIPADERKKIEKLVIENGGQYSGELTKKCTHLICDISFEGDKYKVARKWGYIYIVTRKWFDQSIAKRACLIEESFPVQGDSLSSKKIVRGCFASQNSQSNRSGFLQAALPSVVADSNFTASTCGGIVDSDLETSVSQNMLPKSCAPVFCKEGDSKVPPLESKCEVTLEDCVADDSESEENDLYLSECRISLVGFEASEMRRLVNIIRRGGGTRYMSFNDRLTHIVVGTPSEIEKKEVRGFAACGVIHVVRATWLEDCDREKKEIPVLQQHSACDILLPKGALTGTSGMIQGKISTIHQRMPSDQLCGNRSVATGMDLLEKNRKEVSEINRDDDRSVKAAVRSFDKNRLPVIKDKSKVQLHDKTRGQLKIHLESSVQNGKPSSVFKGKLFRFSDSFPEDRRGEIIEWVNQGGGLTTDAHLKQKAHFTVECHGVIPRSVDSTHTTYVSSHWIRSCLEDGYLLDVSNHILYTPLPCRTPLPGFEHFRFSVSQYEEKDRLLLRNLCFTLGAKFVEKLNKKVTHLLCKFTSGSKYEAACKWGIHRVTCDWIYECVKQNKVIALDQYYPKEVTAEDREAGLCTTSQFPTQDVQMISVGNPSECPSQSQDQSFSPSEAIGRRNENIREEAKESSCTKKARVFKDVERSGLLSSGISISNPPNTTGDQKANTFGEVSQAVPDVASAIEDLLEQTTKIHDGSSESIFASDCAMLGHDPPRPLSLIGLSRHWLNSGGKKDDTNDLSGKQTAGLYDQFSETQTDSQVAIAVDMSRCATPPPNLCSLKPPQLSGCPAKLFGLGFGFDIHRKHRLKRRLKFVVDAELSKPFSLSFGFDSQASQPHDPSPSLGPVPGDIAEIEAYCRIFRAAERLHTALMEALCNPVTGVCSVYYDFPSEEKPLLEDKIVAVIGCMASLLNKAREDVLSGRSSFRVVDVGVVVEDKLPPLAVFRSEMKRCCESLHVALEDWLMPGDDQSVDVWRKLQRLKNVCYDCGFARNEDDPCNTLFANWGPVYFSSDDSEVAFWRGGQVTEEGLKLLLDKGFKTIVDIRAENVKDNIYQAALDDAVASGKVELIRIPVEVGTAPSMEQVEKFASLVSDSTKSPIYLHSKEGLLRASAMVSRWRQHLTRRAVSKQSVSLNGEVGKPSTTEKNALLEKTIHGSNGVLQKIDSVERDEANLNGICNGLISIQGMKSVESDESGEKPLVNFNKEVDPLNAQVPPCNVFSRKEMSSFLARKSITPLTYFNYQLNRLEVLPIARYMNTKIMWRGEIIGIDPVQEVVEAENSNGIPDAKHLLPVSQISASGNGVYLTSAGNGSVTAVVNKFGEGENCSLLTTNSSTNVSNTHSESVSSKVVKVVRKSNGQSPLVSSDDELGSIEGDMCASATGVVRVQSRKKAEMFLVRTDGFSCTREKVTESSLAFTHPSTQQQMLMWKSTPKTVLVLKKLGHELMEQAKEVVSFLYYQEKMNVLVEPDVHDVFARIPGFGFVQTFYTQDTGDLHERVDFVACLGGDGVILHASNLFKGAVPPIVSFNLGSLGFLTSHTFDDYMQDLRQVIHGNNTRDGVYITLRMRLRCEIFRNGKAMPGKVFDVLNEIVVDRGSNPYLSKIECYERDQLITKVQGDGVIVATPTGSTAYSTAAGGSMVHPNVPCMLFTPICPHSLSFRPVILPDSASLELKIPKDARSNAWVSFDGKRRQQLSRGDSIRIAMSQHPLPTVNKRDQTGDWFRSLIRCLNWNERLDQKAL